MKGINYYFAGLAYCYIDFSDNGSEALNELDALMATKTAQRQSIDTINRVIDYAIRHKKTAATALLLDFKAKHFGTDTLPKL